MFGGQVSIRQGSKTCLALWVTLCRVPDLSTTARAGFRGDRGGGYRAGTGTSVTITHFQFGFHLRVLLSPPQYYFTWWTCCDTHSLGEHGWTFWHLQLQNLGKEVASSLWFPIPFPLMNLLPPWEWCIRQQPPGWSQWLLASGIHVPV